MSVHEHRWLMRQLAIIRCLERWPQSEADFSPDEWAVAERNREAMGAIGAKLPVRAYAEWRRAEELFDALGEPITIGDALDARRILDEFGARREEGA